MFEAFFKHNKSADTSVTILEGVDALKLNMELNNIFKLYILFAVIIGKKFFHFSRHIFGQCCFFAADLVRQLFIIADRKPIFFSVACSSLQNENASAL